MATNDTNTKTKFHVYNFDRGTPDDLSTYLGLKSDSIVAEINERKGRRNTGPSRYFSITVSSLDEAMNIFGKYNFTSFKGQRLRMEFALGHPPIPELVIELPNDVPLDKIYRHYKEYGPVVTVYMRVYNVSTPGIFKPVIQFSTTEAFRNAVNATLTKNVSISGHCVKYIHTRFDNVPDFWVPPKVPKKVKGNAIGIPTNITDQKRSTVIAHVVPDAELEKVQPDPNRNVYDNQYGINSVGVTQEPAKAFFMPEHLLLPGQIEGWVRASNQNSTFSEWCSTAFICYESLYHLSSKAMTGTMKVSSLAWGAQLDISSHRLHYGSTWTPHGERGSLPVASCLTVEMRQYGDKDSAAEVLSIRNNDRLPDKSAAMDEGINLKCLGAILSMKCLESGHLVGMTFKSGEYGLNMWDMSKERDQAQETVVKLAINPKEKLWFDVGGMDICTVDIKGRIQSYDIYTSNATNKSAESTSVDPTAMTDIDTPQYFSSCIAVNERDSNVLVGSSHLAQIARWDPRSPTTAAFITAGCRRKDPGNVRCRAFDPVYGVQWNPSDSNEFMSVHRRGVRIWDVRNMASDVYATFHDTDMPYLRSAKWSPHRTDCIAGLTMDGLVRIWKIRKLEGPASPSTPNMTPEPLFVHQGHELVISDFAWCPHTEDVIATVSPSTASHIGGIQVWRPRNLHDSDDHGEP